jgi:membrane carboxypeptidase/penicillin-binding protein
MMQGVIDRGTGGAPRSRQAARRQDRHGTDAKDVWFVGFSPTSSSASSSATTSRPPATTPQGTVAAPIFAAFMREALKDKPCPVPTAGRPLMR